MVYRHISKDKGWGFKLCEFAILTIYWNVDRIPGIVKIISRPRSHPVPVFVIYQVQVEQVFNTADSYYSPRNAVKFFFI